MAVAGIDLTIIAFSSSSAVPFLHLSGSHDMQDDGNGKG